MVEVGSFRILYTNNGLNFAEGAVPRNGRNLGEAWLQGPLWQASPKQLLELLRMADTVGQTCASAPPNWTAVAGRRPRTPRRRGSVETDQA